MDRQHRIRINRTNACCGGGGGRSSKSLTNNNSVHHYMSKIAIAVVSFVLACLKLPGLSQINSNTNNDNVTTLADVVDGRFVSRTEAATHTSTLLRREHKELFKVQSSDVASPYEDNFPGWLLPPWAKKQINYDIPRNESVCFVHVGKARYLVVTLICLLSFASN